MAGQPEFGDLQFGRGRIVNISSRGAFRGEPDAPAYGASKAGLNSLGQSLARALAPQRIFVYCVAPGFVATDMAAALLDGPAGPGIVAQYPMGSGGTHFDNVITAQGSSTGIGHYITTIGTGSTSASPKPFVFLVTDGMDNSQTYINGNFNGSNPLALFSQTACDNLKAQGVTISILYIPYLNITTSSQAVSWAIAEDNQADGQIQYLPGALTSCATTGFFYTANSAADITNALNAMFNQAIQVARITQ